jgi:hypothetical protein
MRDLYIAQSRSASGTIERRRQIGASQKPYCFDAGASAGGRCPSSGDEGNFIPCIEYRIRSSGRRSCEIPQAKDPATATDLLASTYGGGVAVENASVAMAEAANLLALPGPKCSNGIAVPVGNADWPKLVQGLRDAAMTSYKAAQSKKSR